MFEAKIIMETHLIIVKKETPIYEAIRTMVENNITESFIKNHFRRVPIVAQGKLVGIISRKDIIKYILRLRHKDKAAV